MAVCGLVLAILTLHMKGISWASAGDPFFLLTASRPNSSIGGYIFKMEPGTYNSYTIKFPSLLYNPIAVEYDPKEDKIYWSEVGVYRRIRRSRLSGQDMETVLNTADSIIDGLAIDVDRRLLFYSDAKQDIISRMDMQSLNRFIVSSGLDRPRAIVLDTVQRMIYWTDYGSSPKIERADYDGFNRRTLVSSGLRFINALALDIPNQRLYWVDGGTDHVGTSDLLGRGQRYILRVDSGYHFFGLALYKGSLFVTDWQSAGTYTGQSRLIRVDLDGKARVVASAGNSRLNDIHAYSASDVAKAKWTGTAVLAVVIALVIG